MSPTILKTVGSTLGALLVIAAAPSLAQPAQSRPSQTPRAPEIKDVLTLAAAVESLRSVALAPDGKSVAWVEARRGADGRPAEQTEIVVAGIPDIATAAGTALPGRTPATPGPAPRRIGAGDDEWAAAEPAWSPDGRRLAFLSDASSRAAARRAAAPVPGSPAATPTEPAEQQQLWVADLESRKATQVTHLRGQLSAPSWSPDGSAIAFLYIAGRTAAAGPLHAVPRDAGEVGERPEEQRLSTVDLATGEVRAVSPPELFVYEYDWSPDGAAFAATAARGSGDDNWWIAQLYTFVRATGASRSLLQPPFQLANPRWSPDGREIAFIGGLMSDQGATGGDVYDIPAGGGEARNLTPGRPASSAWLGWTAAGQLLSFEIVDGVSGLGVVNPATRQVTTLWRQPAAFNASGHSLPDPGLSLSRDGRFAAAIVSSFQQPPEVWVGRVGPAAATQSGAAAEAAAGAPASDPAGALGAPSASGAPDAPGALGPTAGPAGLGWRQLSHRNSDLRPAWGEARSLHWASDGSAPASDPPQGDGAAASWQIQGWLLAPPTRAAAGRYPLVVLVHGGPASSAKPGWPTVAGVLASQGFYVLLPNPRGSYGQGEAFTRGNVKDFGYGDLRDILAGIDAAAAAAPIDPARAGIYGWSYGGYMTMWAVTQTQRFRAAVAGAGIVDWQSYYGQNRIDQWMIPYFGATVYDDPWIYARSSPISFIKAARTPTLVLQGERDAEVPAPQAYEFWHALRALGIETRLVIYPDEGHHLSPASGLDVMRRTVDWLSTHLR
jgi:dipeptidyl aminopeptidase/acylaminoacyl peptidase